MRRHYILVGDKTTSGARVTEGMEYMTHRGTMLSFLGARIYCPACESEGCIVGTGPRWPDNVMGKHAALDNDLGMCKCQPAPRLIASQDDMFQTFEAHELAEMGFAPTGARLPKPPIGIFHERIRIVDAQGKPVSGVPYHIKDPSGRTYKGLTDASGYCPRVFTENRQDLLVSVGIKALEQWKQ